MFQHGLPNITVGPWQMEDSAGTLHSDEELEYGGGRGRCLCGANPCPSNGFT